MAFALQCHEGGRQKACFHVQRVAGLAYFLKVEDVDIVIALHQMTFDALKSGKRSQIEGAIDEHPRPVEVAVVEAHGHRRLLWKRDRTQRASLLILGRRTPYMVALWRPQWN